MWIDVDAQLVARMRNEAFSNDDFLTSPCIVDDVEDLADECDALTVENDKLRELAKSAWGCVNRRVSCYECRMTCGGCTLQSAMRELGIEVEE